MLYRFAKAQSMDTTQGSMTVCEFDGFEQGSAYTGETMAWAVNAGILRGVLTINRCQKSLYPRADRHHAPLAAGGLNDIRN